MISDYAWGVIHGASGLALFCACIIVWLSDRAPLVDENEQPVEEGCEHVTGRIP